MFEAEELHSDWELVCMYRWVKFNQFQWLQNLGPESDTHRKLRRLRSRSIFAPLYIKRRHALRHSHPCFYRVQTRSLGCIEACACEVWNTDCSHIRPSKMVCRRDESVSSANGLKSCTHYGSTPASDSKLIVGRYIRCWGSSC